MMLQLRLMKAFASEVIWSLVQDLCDILSFFYYCYQLSLSNDHFSILSDCMVS
jgi:hypothetical protein